MKKNRQNYLTMIAVVALIALISLLFIIIKTYLNLNSLQEHFSKDQNYHTYQYHCAFISGSSGDDFWDSVYQSARDAGQREDIYVEYFGRNLPITYSLEEKLKMATAAAVDAILVEPSGNFSTTYLMNAATEAGIAVGTLYRDDLESSRYNYTGVNNISLGYDYGTLAAAYSSEEDTSILLLLNEAEKNSERRLLTSGVGDALAEQKSNARLDTQLLNQSSVFEAEEEIRELLKNNHDSIDVLICTTMLQTQYVSQVVIDMNYVGEFTIIGSYQNPSILEALKNGVISASLVVDTTQMGEKAVENLSEFLQNGHTSDYTPVTCYTITQEDAIRILKSAESDEEGGTSYEN